MKKILLITWLLGIWCSTLQSQIIADFEGVLAEGDSILNGSTGTTEVTSGSARFPISYNPDFGGFWAGNWAISQVVDDSTRGAGNLLGAIPRMGNRVSETYAVGQNGAVVHLEGPARGERVRGLYLTNTTYGYFSMLEGDAFAKKFGGLSGMDPDFFRLDIRGFRDGRPTSDSVSFFLADYRFEADSLDYIVDDWVFVDLLSLGPVDSLVFTLASSDVGDFGINTPLFFAADDLIMAEPAPAPEYIIDFEFPFLGLDGAEDGRNSIIGFDQGRAFFPNVYTTDFGGFWTGGWALSGRMDSITSGFTNLLSARPGAGVGGSLQYAVGQQGAVIELEEVARGNAIQGLYMTNTTYAHNSMRDGDAFAKKFGGVDGTDPDFFKVTIRKYLNGQLGPDSVEVFLADYRFEADSLDFIRSNWVFVDLQSLGPVDSLLFTISSSDVGQFGINTPAFFAMDNLILSDPENEVGIAADDPLVLAWASEVKVVRGPEDLADPLSPLVTAGQPSNAVGPFTPASVSLGDGGIATVRFESPIFDGPGADFVVFENGFPSGGAYFLELALVEVSSDGLNFVLFPPTSLTDTSEQIDAFGVLRPENLQNLAGRFPGRLGTPFDLAVLRGTGTLNVDSITHIRIIDVVGSIDPALATLDREGRAINDPYPTPFPSGGFDLSAVGAIHTTLATNVNVPRMQQVTVWPNPTFDFIHIGGLPEPGLGYLLNEQGQYLRSFIVPVEGGEISVDSLPKGVYHLLIKTTGHYFTSRFLRK